MNDTFSKIRALMGHVEDGSAIVVSVFQDDATERFFVVGKLYGREIFSVDNKDLRAAVDEAYEKYADKE